MPLIDMLKEAALRTGCLRTVTPPAPWPSKFRLEVDTAYWPGWSWSPFMWMHGTLGLGIALLISAILGILLTLAVGSARMLQLRGLAKRPHVVERRPRG